MAVSRPELWITLNYICCAFELACWGDDESDTSSNPENFRWLINLMASMDSAIKDRIKDASTTLQNQLLNCMLEICREEIKNQAFSGKYVGIAGDNTTDVSKRIQSVLVLRYEYLGNI